MMSTGVDVRRHADCNYRDRSLCTAFRRDYYALLADCPGLWSKRNLVPLDLASMVVVEQGFIETILFREIREGTEPPSNF
ncbi:hypothetical protein EVAR_31419_1 [Eumeta japonica]|uniref:Uncharacterized protein n=1 Tax=Eumeta variegata TaxID=151549 RepID=A0A4C1UZR9_EUMVA|nr:hypothetical protein EVAR_31419_1 [Eumeta japonica]